MKKFTNVYVKNFGENLPEEKLEEVFSKFGKITSYKLVSSDKSLKTLLIHPKTKVKDRDSGDNEEGSEGVDDGGDCKNKGYGFVSFQASKIYNRPYILFLYHVGVCEEGL